MQPDVIVVGGGPAGAAAATTLAQGGLDVTLIDKASFPRDKHCGDGLTTNALRILDRMGLDPATVPSWRVVDDVTVVAPSGRSVRFPLPAAAGAYAAIARRSELDASVLDLARRAGADVIESTRCASVVELDDCVEVATDSSHQYRARFLIAADGAWSPVRKLLGLDDEGYRGEWYALRQYYSGLTGPAADRLFVWFQPDLLPGYAWSFPLPDGAANLGYGIRVGGRVSVGEMASRWADVSARPVIREMLGPWAEPIEPPRAWPIPAAIDDVALTSERTLFVGDAARACDPMTGEGIAQALETGIAAAESCLERGPSDPLGVRQSYERRVRSKLLADHRMSGGLGRVLEHRRGCEYAISAAGQTPWTRRNFGRWLFEDYPRALLLTPRRWRRGALTGPGAYRTP